MAASVGVEMESRPRIQLQTLSSQHSGSTNNHANAVRHPCAASPQDHHLCDTDEELLALDEALQRLAAQDPVKAQLVELRYFAGLTGDQAAERLGISSATADRYWA